ncbi:MAG: hypothetical protein SGI72_01225 [Planctomycetota bacterium]|nr:hypothetical protein [Planctomycetota bacterium]
MRRVTSLLASFAVFAALAPVAFAQGTDSCTAPTAIAGVGAFAFNTTTATTSAEGQANPLCNFFGQTAIETDVWFAWTAPSTGSFALSCCTAIYDTKVAVYAGSTCPAAAAIACNDDACSTQSSLQFSATSGNVYLIQFGAYPGSGGGTGNMDIAVFTPPPPCGVSVGPDVIVGDLQEVANYASLNGLDAISLGTISCNVGTVNLSWIAGNNQHPVIGGSLYRYRAVNGSGRFEQIGLSWLKHGFFALSNTLCCTNCQGTDGSSLGVNCADPYTAGRNGSQSGLGPRWQVNALTGAYSYPPANPGWTGSPARRLQYLQADVDTSAGVRYFGEGQYVTPDDAAAGNQNNNASYRELTVNAAGTSFALAATTQRERSAIRAWPVAEPGVTLNDLQVAGDGLFVVGFKTTNLGGGQFHYEYAVYNMNSDRNGGSLSIPVPSNVVVTNAEFHDVEYRNGDGNASANFTNTDWTMTRSASAVTWACETQAVDANANALRWGTTYNFRFDANTAPIAGLATLGLWKVGAPLSVTAAVEVPSSGTAFTNVCVGDGSGTACPCGNNSFVGNDEGCTSSLGFGGRLRASGVASIVADTLTLTSTRVPNGPALYFQGSSQAITPLGDGLLCVGGVRMQLGITFASSDTSSYPSGAQALVHVQGLAVAGDAKTYQAWYRENSSFCASERFNLTNGVQLIWGP